MVINKKAHVGFPALKLDLPMVYGYFFYEKAYWANILS